ncbi:MAG: alanine racemase [Candidatus Loosdrechtia sp.]|uniref:alanine racemase n=1 Tax=Candidatus Loosdrechtia sp. TaxID=3101272 RepID=UPI003A5D5559|nr:MAG: alanine racemase [Candidatus Jettenia sp. AMX2]
MHRPAWVEIDLNALRHNVLAIKKRIGPQVSIIGIVKANAYGHGDYEVSKVLLAGGVDMLGIAIPEEGIQLRTQGIKAPILLLGGVFEEQIDTVIKHDLIPAIYDLKLASLLAKRASDFNKVIKVHIYVDTGMGSIGVKHTGAAEFVKSVKSLKNLFIDGIYTHCSCSDEKESEFTNLQIKRFREVLSSVQALNITVPLIHMANSGAILRYSDAYFTAVRPGLSLYGLYPSEEPVRDIGLKPVMSFKTRIIHIKDMESGDFVGYGRSFKITRFSRIATLPLGYDDGYSRLLSNRGKVIVRGEKASVVGKVCMDQCFADVTDIKGVSVGDEVVLYGTQGQETIPVESVAQQLHTIPYEVTCSIGRRVPRICINDFGVRK